MPGKFPIALAESLASTPYYPRKNASVLPRVWKSTAGDAKPLSGFNPPKSPRVYDALGTHNVFLAGDYRRSFDQIFHDLTLSDSPSFYIHAPVRIAPSAAPCGADTLLALVPVGHLDDAAPADMDNLRARARSAVLHRLAESGVTDLEHHLKFEVSYTPRNWEELYHLRKGAAFGLSHNFGQIGYLRPQNGHRRYHNLHFVGSSTHPGTGLPMVLISARLTTERILKELERRCRQGLSNVEPAA